MTSNDPYSAPTGDPYHGDPYYGYLPPAPGPAAPAASRPARRRLFAAGIAALTAAAVVAGVTLAEASTSTVTGSGSAAQLVPTNPTNPGSGGTVLVPGDMNPSGRSGTSTSVALATAAQQKGIVTVVSVLKYQTAESAGTGMILSSDGEVLTNNHVINGATSITVTVASSGRSYHADVVGTDPSDDVAVLMLRNASGLTTANLGQASDVSVGDAIVGVGNAGGTGTLRASSGKVTALNQSITATDESGQDGEKLTGLIEVNAPIISGDSGGPLYDAAGEVVGMNTAASATRTVKAAYAIPIDSAVKIAGQIEGGVETSKIHIGLPPFLGVALDPNVTQHAVVGSLLEGGPAAAAGISAGSTITAVDNDQVGVATSLRTLLRKHQPGDRVSISWTDASGQSHTATVTLATGPAD